MPDLKHNTAVVFAMAWLTSTSTPVDAQPSKASSTVMQQFLTTATASPKSMSRETAKLRTMYTWDVVHTDAIFEFRGPRELAGYAQIVSKTPELVLTRLTPVARVHRTHYRYKLGGKFDVDHVIGTEHRADHSGKIYLQREFLDLNQWSAQIPGQFLLKTRLGRNLLRLGANYAAQRGLERQGSIAKRTSIRRIAVALQRMHSVAKTHDPSWLQRAKRRIRKRRSAKVAAQRSRSVKR